MTELVCERTVTTDTLLGLADTGTIQWADTTNNNITFTLPVAASAVFYVIGSIISTANTVTITPNAADKFFGCGWTTATNGQSLTCPASNLVFMAFKANGVNTWAIMKASQGVTHP